MHSAAAHPGRGAETHSAATAAAHSAAHPAEMPAAAHGMRCSAATATTSASAASSRRRIGSARQSGDYGDSSENLDV
jgi:hypothetical protein